MTSENANICSDADFKKNSQKAKKIIYHSEIFSLESKLFQRKIIRYNFKRLLTPISWAYVYVY